jgi:hypothetical protein
MEHSSDHAVSGLAGAGPAKPKLKHAKGSSGKISRVAEKVADLHLAYAQLAYQQEVAKLKLALLTELCSLLDNVAPILCHAPQNNPGHVKNDEGGSKAAAAEGLFEFYLQTISDQLGNVSLSSPSSSGIGADSAAGWEANQPSASTLPGGSQFALLQYALDNSLGRPEYMAATKHISDSFASTYYPRFLGMYAIMPSDVELACLLSFALQELLACLPP